MAMATLALDIRRLEMAEIHAKQGNPALSLRILLDRPCATCTTPVPPTTAEDLVAAERGLPVLCPSCHEASEAARDYIEA